MQRGCVHEQQQLKLLGRCILPVGSFRMSRWPPQRTVATSLDAMQAKMLAIASNMQRRPDEDGLSFLRRRGRYARTLARRHGLWSQHWHNRVLNWDAHLDRHSDHPATAIRDWHDSKWLMLQRLLSGSSSIFAGKTGTRATSGKVQPRWQESIREIKRAS